MLANYMVNRRSVPMQRPPDLAVCGRGVRRHEDRVSSAQALPIGELLIAEPDNDRLVKLTERSETIWERKIAKGEACAAELQIRRCREITLPESSRSAA